LGQTCNSKIAKLENNDLEVGDGFENKPEVNSGLKSWRFAGIPIAGDRHAA